MDGLAAREPGMRRIGRGRFVEAGRRGEQRARFADAIHAEMLAHRRRRFATAIAAICSTAEQLQRQRVTRAEFEQAGFVGFGFDGGDRADLVECERVPSAARTAASICSAEPCKRQPMPTLSVFMAYPLASDVHGSAALSMRSTAARANAERRHPADHHDRRRAERRRAHGVGKFAERREHDDVARDASPTSIAAHGVSALMPAASSAATISPSRRMPI